MVTWLTARAALVAKLNGLSLTASGYAAETLTCVEKIPNGNDQPWPISFPIPPARSVDRGPSGMRLVRVEEVRIRFWTGADNAEEAQDRMEAWVAYLIDTIGDSIEADGTAGVVILTQSFTEFSTFGPEGTPPYGFDMLLGVNIADTETRSA